MPKRGCAVVIGVDRTGGLPGLRASAAGAREFGRWLASEEFEVEIITDEAGGRVAAAEIVAAVKKFVDAGTYDQMVIYFSGHGYWKNQAELWLLSGAPLDANEGVNWRETVEFAKDCGIPNVVVISDACRSVPDGVRAQRMRGSIIFPNDEVARERAKVDTFMAAAAGMPAYEICLGPNKEFKNAFTVCFMRAFTSPDADMVADIEEGDRRIRIVPNRRLEKYLKREVSALLSSIDILIDQFPDCEVLSDEHAYIGQAQSANPIAPLPRAEMPLAGRMLKRASPQIDGATEFRSGGVDIKDIAAAALAEVLASQDSAVGDQTSLSELALGSDHAGPVADACSASDAMNGVGTKSGFAVIGATVAAAAASDGRKVTIHANGHTDLASDFVEVERGSLQACTVFIQLTDGRGAALAALQDFVGQVIVDSVGIVAVNYIPTAGSERAEYYAMQGRRLDRLRRATQAAMRFGAFRMNDPVKAAMLAEQIRVGKGLDPAMGLYAAYAYSEADAGGKIAGVRDLMKWDLMAELFDVRMLSSRFSSIGSERTIPVVPFCPMLTQGWNLLRPRRVRLSDDLEAAQDGLLPSVWTTFGPHPASTILRAVKRGDFA